MSLYLAFILDNNEKQKLLPAITYFKQHSICDTYEDTSALHITLKMIQNDDTKHKDIINLMNIWHNKYAKGSIKVIATKFNRFINGKEPVDWIGIDNSLRLYQIKNEFEQLAKELNINIVKDQFAYTPHITLAFNAKLKNNFVSEFLYPIELNIEKIALWGFDNMIKNVHMAATLYMVNV